MNSSYVQGNLLLLNFYLKNISKIQSLPKWMRNPDVLIQEMESKWKDQKNSGAQNFSLKLPNSTANSYNEEFENMKSEMRKLHSGEKEIFPYRTTLILLFCIRYLPMS